MSFNNKHRDEENPTSIQSWWGFLCQADDPDQRLSANNIRRQFAITI